MPLEIPSCCSCRPCSPRSPLEPALQDDSDNKITFHAEDALTGKTALSSKTPVLEAKDVSDEDCRMSSKLAIPDELTSRLTTPTEDYMGKTTTLTRRFGKPEVGNPRRGSILDLQSSDFQLSRALSIQLGLAPDVPAAGEPRKSTSRRASQLLAKNRGVNIENCFEYCGVRTKIKVFEMSADVIHRRPKEEMEEEEEDEDMASVLSTDTIESKASDRSVGSSTGSARKREASQDNGDAQFNRDGRSSTHSGGPRYTRKGTMQNTEALSRWGFIVGSLLHMRAVDFGVAAERALNRRTRKSKISIDGRGKVFNHVREAARVVTKQARKIARRICKELDMFDHEWAQDGLLPELFGPNYVDNISILATAARKILSLQPMLAEAKAPCRIFGDLHGHFRDLLLLFVSYGGPDEHNAPMFIFNGDFVDRGEHQIEVIGLLLALKVLLPERIFLIRGNHEDRSMNRKYGFYEECRKRLGPEVGNNLFDLIHKVFDQLPIACLVDHRVLVVHGGIGDGAWKVDDIRALRRPLLDEQLYDRDSYWIYNILWSDPIEDDDKERAAVFGVHKSPRGGMSAQFGWNVTKTFCARNGLGLVVRSHQSKHDSLGFDVMHEELLMRIFSARDYEGHGNDAAVLFIQPEDPEDPNSPLLVRPQVLAALGKMRES